MNVCSYSSMSWLRCGVVASLLLVFPYCSLGEEEQHDHGHYTNEFAVELKPEYQDHIEHVTSQHQLKFERHLSNLGHVYLLSHNLVSRRSKRSAEDLVSNLAADPRIHYVEQQRVLRRVKRTIVHDKQWELPISHYDDKSVYQRFYGESRLQTKDGIPGVSTDVIKEVGFDDPYFPDQWYLINEGQTGGKRGYDVNVLPVWKKGITGQGVVVSILDDGIDHTHPDLSSNYDAKASADMNDRMDSENDPMPNVKDTNNSHGTRCAGEVAAAANNTNCGVGIAYNAKIGGVRMLDGTVTDMLEAEALLYNNDYIDIYSASWGPSDNGKTMEEPGTYAAKALQKGVTEGRGGKGSIYVWATGNGGMVDDDCSCDGYVSSIYSLSIGCISDQGLSTYFTEICPSAMAVIFTGGAHQLPGMAPADGKPKIKVVTTDLEGDCTLEFQGTSSAAPLAAGCFALVLEANPELTWRDMQHVVVETARIPNAEEEGWTVNGAGHHVNPKFGFGALDCGKMVEAAQGWVNVPPQHRCDVTADNPSAAIGDVVTQTLTTDGCQDERRSRIDNLEHVQAHVTITDKRRGDLRISLTSPSGTRSEILSVRPLDDNNGMDFTFMTVHNWGENPKGVWTLVVEDTKKRGGGTLKSWSLTLWGYAGTKGGKGTKRDGADQRANGGNAHEALEQELKHLMAEERASSENVQIVEGSESSGKKPKRRLGAGDLGELIRLQRNRINADDKSAKRTADKRRYDDDWEIDDLPRYERKGQDRTRDSQSSFTDDDVRDLMEALEDVVSEGEIQALKREMQSVLGESSPHRAPGVAGPVRRTYHEDGPSNTESDREKRLRGELIDKLQRLIEALEEKEENKRWYYE